MGRKVIDLTGQVFGGLTAIRRVPPPRSPEAGAWWECRCICGNLYSARASALKMGHPVSCGCTAHRKGRDHENFTHGMTGTPEFKAWSNMLGRCRNPSHDQFLDYGGRGIAVCQEWQASFIQFYKDMGPRPQGRYSLDRIDNDRNYEPSNCRWTNYITQERNRRSNRLITFGGETMPVSAWTERLGFPTSTIYNRLNHGWTVDRALTTPLRSYPR